jgi:hypothetical protein
MMRKKGVSVLGTALSTRRKRWNRKREGRLREIGLKEIPLKGQSLPS